MAVTAEAFPRAADGVRAAPLAGVELGGTKCVCTLAHGPEAIVDQHTVPTRSPNDTLPAIAEILRGWQREHGVRGLRRLRADRAVHKCGVGRCIRKQMDQRARARVERAYLITVEACDFNCPQHITPRFSEAELAEALAPLRSRLAELEAENARLRSR